MTTINPLAPTSKTLRIIIYAWLAITAFFVFFPILYLVLGAFHSTADIETSIFRLVMGRWNIVNITHALAQSKIATQLGNSVIVTVCQTAGQFLTSVLAAYALVFGRIKREKLVFLFFIAPIMIPGEVNVLVNYLTVRGFGLFDTVAGIFLPYLVNGFTLFLFVQAFRSFPRSIKDAADIDGAGPMRFLFSFLIPMNKSVAMTAIVTSAIAAWNGYMWPLLITKSPSVRTIQPGLKSLASEYSADTGMILAGLLVASIPMLLIVLGGQKYLQRGLTEGSGK